MTSFYYSYTKFIIFVKTHQ